MFATWTIAVPPPAGPVREQTEAEAPSRHPGRRERGREDAQTVRQSFYDSLVHTEKKWRALFLTTFCCCMQVPSLATGRNAEFEYLPRSPALPSPPRPAVPSPIIALFQQRWRQPRRKWTRFILGNSFAH